MGLGLMGKGGKIKNLALKSIEEEIDDSEDEDQNDEDEDEDEDEDLTFKLMRLLSFFNLGKRTRTNLLGNPNPLGRERIRNPLSSALSAKVLVI